MNEWAQAANRRLKSHLRERTLRVAAGPSFRVEGQLRRVVGLTLEAVGCQLPVGARARIARLFDEGTFVETDADVKSSDPLKFVDSQPYPERIKRYEKESGLPEAVVSGTGKIHGIDVSVDVSTLCRVRSGTYSAKLPCPRTRRCISASPPSPRLIFCSRRQKTTRKLSARNSSVSRNGVVRKMRGRRTAIRPPYASSR